MKKTNKKKNSPRRKVHKTSITHSNPAGNQMALVTIPVDEITKPITYKGKYSITETPFTERQLLQMIAPTPKNVVLKRPGKGGRDFDYIPGWWFKKKLNFTFGWMHDFEILGERIDGDFVTVKGKLVIKNSKGNVLVTKTDFGGHPIQFLKGSQKYLDISNDFKAAATDCLKRCAVQLGIGLDVYSAGEYQSGDRPAEPQQPMPVRPQGNVIEAKVVQSAPTMDYIAKLNRFLDEHPKGPFTVKEKIRFIHAHTKIVISNYGALEQRQAQVILANLIQKRI